MGKTYLGDSVYAERNEWGQVTLFTHNGEDRANEIFLEPEVLGNFMEYLGVHVKEVDPASAMFRQGEGGKFTSDGKIKVKDGEV